MSPTDAQKLRRLGLHPAYVDERQRAKDFNDNGNIIPSTAQLETVLQWARLTDANRVELHQRVSDGRLKAWLFADEPEDDNCLDRLKLTFTGEMN